MNYTSSTNHNAAVSDLCPGTAFEHNGIPHLVIKSATLDAKFRQTKTVRLDNGDVSILKPTTIVKPLYDAVVDAG